MDLNEPAGQETKPKELDKYIEERYQNAIQYYWNASRSNKKFYKLTRGTMLVLGALVTLVASLASTEFVNSSPFWDIFFGLLTPILAAILTIVTGFSQTFQWGAAWSDMVLTAERLEKEYDRFKVTDHSQRDLQKEAQILNDFVLEESMGFFQRMLGSTKSKVLEE